MILEKPESSENTPTWIDVTRKAEAGNSWFTAEQIRIALAGWVELLQPESLHLFSQKYSKHQPSNERNIGVIMAGNIPAAGFHDLLCVSLAGHQLSAKLASTDQHLLPFVVELLRQVNPALAEKISFVENLKDVDAVIATGSDNSARYFEYYFGKKPHIFRRNRNSVAVLTGDENEYDLILLGKDIFTYFGLGCRSVSKLFVPKGYSFDMLFESMLKFEHLLQHARYMNNHDYQQAIYLMNNEPFLTNNFLIVKEDSRLSSPVGVLYYETYESEADLKQKTALIQDKLQCVIRKDGEVKP
ncbi:MAG: acyl-CoA reductase, partial [Bacteroidota bacterium]